MGRGSVVAVASPSRRGSAGPWKSDGERFYVEKFDDYVARRRPHHGLAKSREPGLPVFLLGHSAGGVVSCLYTLDHQKKLAGLICESFAFQVPAPDFALAVFKGLGHLAPHAHVLHLKNEEFSRDPRPCRDERGSADRARNPADQTIAEIVRADERLKRDSRK